MIRKQILGKTFAGKKLNVKVKADSGRPYVRPKMVDESGNESYPFVYLDGDPFSREMYDDLQQLRIELGIDQVASPPVVTNSQMPAHQPQEQSFRVVDLVEQYRAWHDKRRRHGLPDESKADRAQITLLRRACLMLMPFAERSAAEFTLADLKRARQIEIDMTGNCRKTINEKISVLKRMFRWGAEEGIFPDHVFLAINALKPLGNFDHDVPASKVVHAPDEADLLEAIKLSPPVLATMLTVQMHTGLRPGNICNMRWEDIDTSDEDEHGVWIYRPSSHKTEKHLTLISVLGPHSVEALKKHRDEMITADSGFVFSRRVAEAYRLSFAKPQQDKLRNARLIAARLEQHLGQQISLDDVIVNRDKRGAAIRQLRDRAFEIEKTLFREKTGERCEYTLIRAGILEPLPVRSVREIYEKHTTVMDRYDTKAYRTDLYDVLNHFSIPAFFPSAIRHFYSANLVANASRSAAQAVMGHLTDSMVTHYSKMRQDINLAIETQRQLG